jgi:hypothetical protein
VPVPTKIFNEGHFMSVDPGLQANVDAFCAQLDELLRTSPGKYVVYAKERLVKVCDSLEEALALGYNEFGNSPFLVQRVEPMRSQLDFQLACQA